MSSLYGAFPDVDFSGDVNDTGFNFQGWTGTTVEAHLNGEIIDTYTIEGDGVSISLTDDISDISATAGEEIEFLHLAGNRKYELEFLTNDGEVFWEKNISGGAASTQVNNAGDYLIRNKQTGNTASLTISDEKIQQFVSVPRSAIRSGENSVLFDVSYTNDEGDEENNTQEFTFNYEKYENTIDVDVENNYSKSTSKTINLSVEDPSLPYYYIVNRDGAVSSCFFTQNELNITDSSQEVTISGLSSGENSVRIISTKPDDCNVFTGEKKFEIIVDRVAPSIELYEASLDAGTDGEPIDVEQFSSEAYLNKRTLNLKFESDASILNYTLNGRGEGPLVDAQIFDQIDWIDKVEIESTGSRLNLDIYPYEDYQDAYVEYNYNERDREEEANNGIIPVSFSLNEEYDRVNFSFYQDDDTGVQERTMKIYDLAYQDKGTLKSADYNNKTDLFVIKPLSLEKGKNNLRLYAYDEAGNLKKKNHVINFDNSEPEINWSAMSPDSMFESEEARSPVVPIEGGTNKGNVEVTMFTIPQGTQIINSDGESEEISCDESHKDIILRSLGQLDGDDPDSNELNLEEQQLSLSLGSLLNSKNTVTSNSNGEFDETYISFQSRDFDRGDFNDAQNNNREAQEVASENEICFVLKDKYGNVNIQSKSINYDAGNTLWTPGQVTLTPNTAYASEIEQTGDQNGANNGRVQFSVMATFTYQGEGNVNHVEGIRVNEDRVGQENAGTINIKNSDLNYRYQEGSNEMLVYFPVEISPLNKKPLNYPDELELKFEMDLTYDVDNQEVPIDTTNPVYFQSQLNVEKPLNHAKWLSPSTIEDGLEFLNESIRYTEKAVEWTRMASVAGVVACTGTRLWYQFKIAQEQQMEDPDQQQINEYKERIFWVCDRVACSSSPSECQSQGENNFLEVEEGENLGSSDLSKREGAEFISEGDNGRTLGRITELDIKDGSRCTTSTGKPGVIASFEAETYKEDNSMMGTWKKTEETRDIRVRQRCVEAQFEDSEGNQVDTSNIDSEEELPEDAQVSGLNMQDYGNACYTEGAPNFDQTRCFGKSGWDPKNNVIESAGCGCITDTYSHLKNILKVQEGIQKCLQEAKLGMASGSYCERLLSQAVCDVATNLVFSGTLGKITSRTGEDGDDPHNNAIGEFFGTMSASNNVGNDIVDQRYDGTILSQSGMSTDQIVNNVCLAAATGDWSALEENIMTSVDQNQVEPTLGPAFPESRMMGVNPFSGDLTIQYRFTHAVVSGGQNVRTEVNFICDKSQPGGQYCPEGRATAEELDGEISSSTLTVREDQASQDTIVLTDESSRFRYNVLELVHTYEINGEEQTEVQEERIRHNNNGLIAQCNWNGGTFGSGSLDGNLGINCDRMFSDDAKLQQFYLTDKSKLVPEVGSGDPVFYPGNPLRLFGEYSIRGREQAQNSDARLYYKITCNSNSGPGSTRTTKFDNIPLKHYSGSTFGKKTFTLVDELPEFAIPKPEGSYQTSTEGSTPIPEGAKLRAIYTGNDDSTAAVDVVNVAHDGQIVNGFTPVRFSGNEVSEETAETVPALEGKEIGALTLYLNANVNNKVTFELVGSEEEEVIGSFSRVQPVDNPERNTDLENLGKGQCTLDTKVLPQGLANGLTSDNFDDFSPENMNLTNVESPNNKEFTFTLSERSENDHSFRMEAVNKQRSVCAYETSTGERQIEQDIHINVPFVTSNDGKVEEVFSSEDDMSIEDRLEVSYSGTRYSLEDNFFEVDYPSREEINDNKAFQIKLSPGDGNTLPSSFSQDDIKVYVTFTDWNDQEHTEEIELSTSSCDKDKEYRVCAEFNPTGFCIDWNNPFNDGNNGGGNSGGNEGESEQSSQEQTEQETSSQETSSPGVSNENSEEQTQDTSTQNSDENTESTSQELEWQTPKEEGTCCGGDEICSQYEGESQKEVGSSCSNIDVENFFLGETTEICDTDRRGRPTEFEFQIMKQNCA